MLTTILLQISMFAVVNFALNTNQTTPVGGIFDISAEILLTKEGEVDLRIDWRDTIPSKESAFDVKVTPDPKCRRTSCSVYGQRQRPVMIPNNPMRNLEHRECVIERNCSYRIKVESGKFSNETTIRVPECLSDLDCACNNSSPTAEIISGKVLANHSLILHWNISHLARPEGNGSIKTATLDYHSVRISQQSNPSLSWGGKHILIADEIYPIYNLNLSRNWIVDSATIATNAILSPNVNYTIQSQITYNRYCKSEPKQFILTATSFEPKFMQSTETINYLQIVKITVPIILIVVVAIVATWYIRRDLKQSKKVTHIPLRHIPMSDNFLYVDKDIQEAQEKGKADMFEISRSLITIGEEIGSGAFGQVFKATARKLSRRPNAVITVAVKRLKNNPNEDEMEEFLSEIQTLKNAGRHENIVALLGCCTVSQPLMMVMEYVGRGDLLRYLRNVREKLELNKMIARTRNWSQTLQNKSSSSTSHSGTAEGNYLELQFSAASLPTSDRSYSSSQRLTVPSALRPSVTETEYTYLSPAEQMDELMGTDDTLSFEYAVDHKELHNFAVQICKGMKHLEEKGIIHRDLAARNVLIDDRKVLKISDFGLSRKGIYVNTKGTKLPLRWLSIEAILEKFYSNKSDVWAFGIVLWEIGNLGAVPYSNFSNKEIVTFLSTGGRLEKPEICTDELYDLMLKCWDEDLEMRPSFEDILKWLQPLQQTIYVDINTLSDDYVFPPTTEPNEYQYSAKLKMKCAKK